MEMEDKQEELKTESMVHVTCVSVRQGQADAVISFRRCPSESASELISPHLKQTSDSGNNCRVTNLLYEDSDAAFCTNHVIVDNVKKCDTRCILSVTHLIAVPLLFEITVEILI